jgi:hypothetical protein
MKLHMGQSGNRACLPSMNNRRTPYVAGLYRCCQT